jgi:hypothetical protein
MLRILAVVAALAALSGCGPSRAAALHADAEQALATAREAGAVERAPYEWTAAEAYLRASKEEAGRADFEGAATLAEKCLEFAEKARAKALSDPAPAPAPDPNAPPAPAPAPDAPADPAPTWAGEGGQP